jgi:tetratricopeptide (TPR) repeat protein
MLGPFRGLLTSMALGGASMLPSLAQAQDPSPKPIPPDQGARLAPADFALPGEDPPKAFVPARPRTIDEQKRVEALRYFTVARSYEERRQFSKAIESLEKALEGNPDPTPMLRRLARINFALGKDDPAVSYARRVLQADPGDVETIELLIRHYRDDPAAAETLLKDVLKNEKLGKNSFGALYVEFELGNLYEASLQFDKAAASFAKVVEALDDKLNGRLSPNELRRFLGNDEAQAYLRFGRVFLQARKTDLAVKAFQRGLVYDADEPLLLILLSQTYLEAGKAAEALALVERYLTRQPRGRETFDLLAKILTSLKRENEILPRLEKYAAADRKNVPLQYALAERYNLAGQPQKAQEIFNTLLAEQRDTQEFNDLFPKLLKEKKSEELLQLLSKVSGRLKRLEAVRPQIEQLVANPQYADELLDVGLKMLSSKPPTLDPDEGWSVLQSIAIEGQRFQKLANLYRWLIARAPNPLAYKQLIIVLKEVNSFDEAEARWKEMVEKFPDERNSRSLALLSEVQSKAGKLDAAIATAREALKLDPTDSELLRGLANLLVQAEKNDEAVATVRSVLKLNPNDPDLTFLLGGILMRVKKSDESIAVFRSLIDRFPNDEQIIKIAYSSISSVYSDLNDFPKAEAELETIFAKYPDDAGINNDLGYLYADQGKNLEKAEAMIRKAVAEDSDNYAYLDSLGWVLFKRGKFQEARTPLEKAQADPRSDSTIPDHLGDVYFQLQEHAKAKAAWERALKIATETKPADKRLGEIQKKLKSLQEFVPAPKPKTGDNP